MINREIKFRAWDKQDREFVYFGPLWGLKDHTEKPLDDGYFEISQALGLTDMDGKYIWEGDILYSFINGKRNYGDVRWDGIRAAFYIRFADDDVYFPSGPKPERFQVVGNIWENAYLLK